MVKYNHCMFNQDDWLRVNNKTKRYRLSCDACGADRGYGMKSRSPMLCRKCAHAGRCYFDHSVPAFKETMSKAKKGQIPHNRGTRRYTVAQRTLRCNVSTAIRIRLNRRGSSKKGQTYLSTLGYTVEQLCAHLESQFFPNPRNGLSMTWTNWGRWSIDDNTWHIDHIKPDSTFTYSSMEDQGFKDSWALSNLRPLWAHDNLKKGNKSL